MASSTSGRLIIVSNRLPVTVVRQKDRIELRDSAGGLATGLDRFHRAGDCVWVGWPGEAHRGRGATDPELDPLLASRRLVPVYLTAQAVRQYYEGFSNGVIWPLFHYLLDRVPLRGHEWQAYVAANQKFAEAVAAHAGPGDTVWIHDYQLLLLPSLLRRRLPGARIGFFLHIPFPSSELFRILPWRRELLEGLLGADLVGFHTYSYVRHFVVAARQILGLEPGLDRLTFDEREVRFGYFPMGVDADSFAAIASASETRAEADAIRAEAAGRKILLGIDRLDYTKGIPRRLLAFERLLESDPALVDRVRLVQVAVPSRSGIEPYQQIRRQVEEIVGRINGRFGSVGVAPVHYLYQRFPAAQLTALYRAADVMVVTPLRDGMNLVAKEFVASRVDEDGVLVLSEFAGAGAELAEALFANPYDIEGVAGLLRQALEMPPAERRTRMQALRVRVRRQTVHDWSAGFLAALAPPRPRVARLRMMSDDEIGALARRLREADRPVLLLDYDGTLVPFARLPELAEPDQELLRLLDALAQAVPGGVHIVSGRARPTLDRWLGGLQVQLWAEHGLWHRLPGTGWRGCPEAPTDWMPRSLEILESFRAATPGSLIETKSRSLAWHYRTADPELGADRARQLRRALAMALQGHAVDVLKGHKVVEIRPRGIDKSRVVRHVLADGSGLQPPLILAVGDDRTDEDMFGALPRDGISVRVGMGPSQALFRLPGPPAVRDLVRSLLE